MFQGLLFQTQTAVRQTCLLENFPEKLIRKCLLFYVCDREKCICQAIPKSDNDKTIGKYELFFVQEKQRNWEHESITTYRDKIKLPETS